MSPSILPDMVTAKLDHLRQVEYAQLAKMPTNISENIPVGKRFVSLTVWIDKVDVECLRIVVQAYDKQGGLMGKMSADGFRMDAQSRILPLTKCEIYEFL